MGNPQESAVQPPRWFGTDGVRAVAGEGPLMPHNVLALGRAFGQHLRAALQGRRPLVLIGVDSRPSADMVGMALAAGLMAESCDVQWSGMMSTPEVAYLTGKAGFDAGVSVTASHNPAVDNGIKLFGHDGRKLPDNIESALEQAIHEGRAAGTASPMGTRFGWFKYGRERYYEEFMVGRFRGTIGVPRPRRLMAVFDAARGARSVDLQLLSRLAHSLAFGTTTPKFKVGSALQGGTSPDRSALDVYFMNAATPTQPQSHHLINVDCGSTHPEGSARAVTELKADLGVCFDGDGDRCILIDETGAVRDGDHMLALLARSMKAKGTLKNDVVVTTTMANLGLEKALTAQGIRIVRTDVGDRHVAAAMAQHGATLGGEQSGHIIISDEGHDIGDGMYTALRVIEAMLEDGRPLSALCADLTKFPQRLISMAVKAKPPLAGLPTLAPAMSAVTGQLGARGRINVRYSGTEPLLRIMVEAEDEALLESSLESLRAAAQSDLVRP